MKNFTTALFTCLCLACSPVVFGDIIKFDFGAGNEDAYKSFGLLDCLSLTAEDTGTGVLFTFSSTYNLGDSNHADGAGKIHDNKFYIWNANGIFSGGDGVTAGGSLNGAKYPDTNIKLGTADYTVSTSGYTYSTDEDLWQVTFTLNYADGFGWEDFLAILANSDNESYETFTVGVHLQALESGNSAKVVTSTVGDDNQNVATPEPGTLFIFGLGMTVLGGWSIRRRKIM